ncbi:MAG: hypothetical protein JSR17_06660 [Proteobacteria bacterium]|nr:hypothetical protein [Pseudomonadota bacterium]
MANEGPVSQAGQFALNADAVKTLRGGLRKVGFKKDQALTDIVNAKVEEDLKSVQTAPAAPMQAVKPAPVAVAVKIPAKAPVKNLNAGRPLPVAPKKVADVPPPPPPRTDVDEQFIMKHMPPAPPVRTVSLPVTEQAQVATTGAAVPPPPPPPPAPAAPAPVVVKNTDAARGALLTSINTFKAGALKKVTTVEKGGLAAKAAITAPANVGAPILPARTLAAEQATKPRAQSEPAAQPTMTAAQATKQRTQSEPAQPTMAAAGFGANDELKAKLAKRLNGLKQ